MTLDELTNSPGEWLAASGPDHDIVISSRLRLARNINEYPFLTTASPSERRELYNMLVEQLGETELGGQAFTVDLNESSELDRALLVERHLISRQQASAEGSRGVSIWPDESKAVMLNEEDHLRMQGLRSGLTFDEVWQELTALDTELGHRLEYAYDKKLGYLTACPTNVGTGIRVSVMVHLPALKITGEIDKVSRATKDMRLAVRGLYGEGTEAAGDLYQISNQVTLGRSEQDIISEFSQKVIPRVVAYERAARDSLLRHHVHELDDRLWRAYGILANARCISSEETITLLSAMRMGIHMGRFDRIEIQSLNQMFLLCQPAHLQKRTGRELDGFARATARATLLREQLNP